MAVDVILTKWGLTMEEGTLVDWLVNVGDNVTEGQALANVETDKIVNELESPAAGVISEILVAAGTEEVPVGAVLCRIDEG
jgi:pyruvate/2-oxoglutarate dehydrogenase complex dihydrolipoamide acyltransferase (E2) component